jgi:hypothetical protein
MPVKNKFHKTSIAIKLICSKKIAAPLYKAEKITSGWLKCCDRLKDIKG